MKTTTIEVYKEDKDILDNLAKFRKETYKAILHRILKNTVRLSKG